MQPSPYFSWLFQDFKICSYFKKRNILRLHDLKMVHRERDNYWFRYQIQVTMQTCITLGTWSADSIGQCVSTWHIKQTNNRTCCFTGIPRVRQKFWLKQKGFSPQLFWLVKSHWNPLLLFLRIFSQQNQCIRKLWNCGTNIVCIPTTVHRNILLLR